jgi:hypothetical protein
MLQSPSVKELEYFVFIFRFGGRDLRREERRWG